MLAAPTTRYCKPSSFIRMLPLVPELFNRACQRASPVAALSATMSLEVPPVNPGCGGAQHAGTDVPVPWVPHRTSSRSVIDRLQHRSGPATAIGASPALWIVGWIVDVENAVVAAGADV